MAEHVWSILCHHAIIDRDTNSLSLLLTIDRIMLLLPDQKPFDAAVAEGMNNVGVKFVLVSGWVRSDYSVPEEATATFRIIGPSGNELRVYEQEQVVEINLKERTGFRSRVDFNGFPVIDGLGVYWIEVDLVDKKRNSSARVARLPINITLQDRPQSQPFVEPEAPTPASNRKPKRAPRRGKRR